MSELTEPEATTFDADAPPSQSQRSTNVLPMPTHVLRVAAPGLVIAFPFPGPGSNAPVVVGRGLEATIRIPMADMSRRHLALRWDDEQLMVSDVGSSNGTTLRGERLVPNEWKPLALRELVIVSDGALVVHEGSASDVATRVVGHEAFEATLEAQLSEFSETKEPFGVCSIELDSQAPWTEFVAGVLSRTDSIGFLSERSVRVLLKGRSVAEIEAIGAFLTRGLTAFSAARSVNMKLCPRDGESLMALYSGARETRDMSPQRETRRPSAPIIQSHAMAKVYELVAEVASTPTSILILGETGVGKDVLAREIHQRSNRSRAPLVGLNCAALPETLLESELFGYERGAFTGAVVAKPGLIESAEGGTVFLDEVGEMPLATQAKLLRVLEERKVMRLGGLRPKAVDFRLIAATNRNLQAEISAGRFRADLFYRINGLALSIPPLRKRRDEIVTLTHHFAENAAATLGKTVPLFSPEVIACFDRYTWPGNIRELKSVVERAVLLARGGIVTVEHLPEEVSAIGVSRAPPGSDKWPAHARLSQLPGPTADPTRPTPEAASMAAATHPPTMPRVAIAPPAAGKESNGPPSLRNELERLECERITAALAEAGGNQTRAASALGMTRRALIIRLERYGITRPRKKTE